MNKKEVVREIEEEEFIRLTEELFSKWSKAKTKIAQFMQGLDSSKIYTEAEIKKYCQEKEITYLGQMLKPSNNGQILKYENNTYYLYPELVKKYSEYFK
jgi:hypothetical protein